MMVMMIVMMTAMMMVTMMMFMMFWRHHLTSLSGLAISLTQADKDKQPSNANNPSAAIIILYCSL